MLDVTNPLIQLKLTSAICSFFAFGTAGYRLYIRRDRLWADDLCVLFATLSLVVQVVAVFLHVPIPNNLSQTARVAAYYLMATTFYAVIWGSRLSILLSIVRIDPAPERRQRFYFIAAAFILALLMLLAQLLWVCEPEPSWKLAANPQCKLSLQVAVFQLVSDVLADAILLIAPLPLFRHLSDKALRRKLTIIFSTCIVTTIVSLVHAVLILKNGGTKVVIAALVEDTLSLIVANVPVVITSAFQITGELNHTSRGSSLRFTTLPWHFRTQNTTTITESDDYALDTVDLRSRSGRSSRSRHSKSYKDKAPDVEIAVQLDPEDARSPTRLLQPQVRSIAFVEEQEHRDGKTDSIP
uniref:Rhodopsin domain-containing protein n=1 Tax=Mycena chlorophos TaxID=658473 RepID=A0ABQ0LLF1_MYCCL|nr:predicted protein [Mycena chlorophos]